jgi:hypothetical protein
LIGFFSIFSQERATEYLAAIEKNLRILNYVRPLSAERVNLILSTLEEQGLLVNQAEENEPRERLINYIKTLSDVQASQFFETHAAANEVNGLEIDVA